MSVPPSDTNLKNQAISLVLKEGRKWHFSGQTTSLALEMLLLYFATPTKPKNWTQFLCASTIDIASKAREVSSPMPKYYGCDIGNLGQFIRQHFLPIVAPKISMPSGYDLYLACRKEPKQDAKILHAYIKYLRETKETDSFKLFAEHWPELDLSTCNLPAYRETMSMEKMTKWWHSIPLSFRPLSLRGAPLKGKGSFGSVYLRDNLVTKTFEYGELPTFSFIRELGNMIVLHGGPGIQLHSVSFGTTPQLKMDYGGIDLVELIDEQNVRFSAAQIGSLFHTWCIELKYAHDRGIGHRDLSNRNLLVYEGNIGRICDWGAGRFAQRVGEKITEMGDICTPSFMAPEGLLSYPTSSASRRGEYPRVCYPTSSDSYGFKYDIWTLGCNLIFLADPPLFDRVFAPGSFAQLCTLLGRPTFQNSGVLYPHFIKKYGPVGLRQLPGRTEHWPKGLHTLKAMLHYSPQERPTIDDLLVGLAKEE